MAEDTPRERSNDLDPTENAHADVDMDICGEVEGGTGLGDDGGEHVGVVQSMGERTNGSDWEGSSSDFGQSGVDGRANVNAATGSNVKRDRDGDVLMEQRAGGPTDDGEQVFRVDGRAGGDVEGEKRAGGDLEGEKRAAFDFEMWEVNEVDDDGDTTMG